VVSCAAVFPFCTERKNRSKLCGQHQEDITIAAESCTNLVGHVLVGPEVDHFSHDLHEAILGGAVQGGVPIL
jgi:hypothetical protein